MTSPFAAALGPAFAMLPAPVQALHAGAGRWAGEVQVSRGTSLAARSGLALGRFPPSGRGPLTLTVEPDGAGEIWTREFGPHIMRSRLTHGPAGLRERIGAITVTLSLTAARDALTITLVQTRLLGLPLPAILAPRSLSRESMDGEGRFTFDIGATLPGAQPLIRYTGWLTRA